MRQTLKRLWGDLANTLLVEQMAKYPDLQWKFEGEEERRKQALGGIADFMPIALLIMYALLAVPFKSYVQPVIVLLAIPFGLAGAVWGAYDTWDEPEYA